MPYTGLRQAPPHLRKLDPGMPPTFRTSCSKLDSSTLATRVIACNRLMRAFMGKSKDTIDEQ
eukprot:scaffold54224_cov18-Tisochrysis_lutea.AAC.3